MSPGVGEPTMWNLTRSHTNQAVQLLEMQKYMFSHYLAHLLTALFFYIFQPSSSSQAAELLVSQGTGSTSGFIGFGQGPKYVPASETLDDIDSSLDSDFRMVLRKLTKRDSTTKSRYSSFLIILSY